MAITLTRELELECHVTTRRRLHEAGIHCYIPAVKEKLTPIHKAARLRFAEQYADRGQEFWRTVIYTDETTFSSVYAKDRHCWRRQGSRFNGENKCERAQSGRVSVPMYGCMWYGGPGELVPIEGYLNAAEYINILETCLIPSVHAYALPEPHPIRLVQDWSPIHTSRAVRQWFSNRPDVELIDWPPKGCDLNAIENLWGLMKCKS
ncbi:hypothetical protein Pmani_009215 [Petrolisthes manimaculis]|uniref:Transposase n=1 Tax=Petrolisthes manimaculis TaxID=1843537 RepID=A0AAE1Q3X1_9EUCA|nr:hypothetical protein Pmani_009215 [Petrolisthes manimaculis]